MDPREGRSLAALAALAVVSAALLAVRSRQRRSNAIEEAPGDWPDGDVLHELTARALCVKLGAPTITHYRQVYLDDDATWPGDEYIAGHFPVTAVAAEGQNHSHTGTGEE